MSDDKEELVNAEVCVRGMDIVGLYLFLKKNEEELESSLFRVYRTLEASLFESLSIDSFENLNDFYNANKER
jgi:hypothetical protein